MQVFSLFKRITTSRLKSAIEKLALNDSSFTYEFEKSDALGFGFRCGFLGLLHMEIVRERLEREFSLELISTAPTVVYRMETVNSEEAVELANPSDMPEPNKIKIIYEPFARISIHTPADYIGVILELCESRRGRQIRLDYSSSSHVLIEYSIPFNEVVMDFYDILKSSTKGYASLEYKVDDYQESNLVRLDILINGDPVDALSAIVHKSKSEAQGRMLAKRLKEIIPKQQFQVAIQAAIGAKVIARETLSALRKDVTAKCYGGDISRKRKLLEKQKAGKKRMKQLGSISLPQEAFLAVLKSDDSSSS